MNPQTDVSPQKPFRVCSLSKMARFRLDLFREARRYWLFPLWTEVNMDAVVSLRERQAGSGVRVTFTAFLAKAVADAVAALKDTHPEINSAILEFPWKRIAYFDAVDVAIACEKRHKGEDYFYVGIIRNADALSLEEVASALKGLAEDKHEGFFKETLTLVKKPGWLRRLALWTSRNWASLVRAHRGTVFLSSVGKYGVNGFAMTNHNISFSFGRVAERPVAVRGQVTTRSTMTLTMVIDHRTINGGPAARLMSKVKENLESCAFHTKEKERQNG